MELKDKIVLVTGSSSGIGQTTAIRFAKEGARVIIHYHENKVGAESTQQKIQAVGVDSLVVRSNLANEIEIKDMFANIEKEYGTLDILINNAAISVDTIPFLEADQKHFIELLNVNVVGTMICSQEAIRLFKKNGSGKIINNSSIKGIEYGGGGVLYAATKAAINSITKTLAKQVAPQITVNAVAPGYVKTRSYDGMTQDKIDSYLNQTYLKRWVTEEEIADAFVFLAKNDAMTGQVIYVDAGFTLK